MTTPGFFEIYPSARPALPAGLYSATSHQDLMAAPPHGGDGVVPVDDTQFHVHIDAPRYVMPPDQILSTFPPASAQGDWRERLPQIVLKRRTLPWERNPTFNPQVDPHVAPPWLALVVLADGEGQLSTDVDVANCVTAGVDLGDDADVAQGKYLEVTQDIIDKVFPCQDELELLCHVRKVDLRDTELALGDDDGYLAVVLSNRLPQPAAPKNADGDALPLKYTAYLINLEHQLGNLVETEPEPVLFFDAANATVLVNEQFLLPPPNATLDQLAMQLGPADQAFSASKSAFEAAKGANGARASAETALVPYAAPRGLEPAAASWATGPVKQAATVAGELALVGEYKAGLTDGILPLFSLKFRFPVLVSWEFTCTGSGGFERLMNDLDVGLLGTLDEDQPPPLPEVALTGHVALSHRTRRGEPARSWFRGPLGPQPTERIVPVAGVLPLAHTGDQLRKVVPDGREDISLAALFEIGRLLTLNKPTLVAALMQWRRELFGAARARELGDLLSGLVFSDLGIAVAGGRNSLEDLIRTHFVGAFTGLAPGQLAPDAQEVTRARIPKELLDIGADEVLAGLGADPRLTRQLTKQFGVDGLGAVPVTVAQASTAPVSQDRLARAILNNQLAQRVDELTANALKVDQPTPGQIPKGQTPKGGSPSRGRSRREDSLDRLIAEATEIAVNRSGGD
jgi:hypothetical protein